MSLSLSLVSADDVIGFLKANPIAAPADTAATNNLYIDKY